MSRFLSAYNTTGCAGYVVKPIQDAIRVAFINGDIALDATSGCLLVTGLSSSSTISTFNHPISLDFEGTTKTFTDVRSCVKLEPHTTNFKIANAAEYEFIIRRAHLSGLWTTDMPTLLRDVSKLPLATYAFLISELTARRLALDPRDQLVVLVLAAVFYLNLFNDDGAEKKNDAFHMSGIIATALSMKQITVMDIIEGHTVITDLADFCTVCQEVSGSVRLRDLNPVTLIGIVGGAWYGNNGRELMAVALEHPPTWLSLLYRALRDRGMINSGLGKFLDRGLFKKLGVNYPDSIDQLLKRSI